MVVELKIFIRSFTPPPPPPPPPPPSALAPSALALLLLFPCVVILGEECVLVIPSLFFTTVCDILAATTLVKFAPSFTPSQTTVEAESRKRVTAFIVAGLFLPLVPPPRGAGLAFLIVCIIYSSGS